METQKQKHIEGTQNPHTMTFEQRESLNAQLRQHHLQWFLVGGILWIVALVMLFVADLENTRFITAPIMAVIGLIPMAVGFIKWRQGNNDLRAGSVEYIDGAVSTYTQSAGRNGKSFHLSIGDQKFMIPKDMFLSINKGKTYRVYYAPNTRFVVSVEPLKGK